MSELETDETYEPTAVELRERGSIKWTRHGPDVLGAWVAEMDFGTAPEVQQAIEGAVAVHRYGYPPPADRSGVPEAVSEWYAATTGWRPDPARIQLLPDVLKGVELAIRAFSPPGSAVVLPTPSYPPFFQVVSDCGRETVRVPVVERAGRPALDLDRIDAELGAGAATVVLCNPYNPLGRAFTAAELAALAEVVERRGARVVADEVHAPLVYPGSCHVPYASISELAARHSVTLISASKGWNVAGLKCAEIIITSEAAMAAWERLPRLAAHGVSTLGILANEAAFRHGGTWMRQTVDHLDRNRHALARLLAERLPEVRYRIPEATYLAWLDCRELGLEEPAAFFLEHARVAMNEGTGFGAPGFLRLNFGTSAAILDEIVARLAQAIRDRG